MENYSRNFLALPVSHKVTVCMHGGPTLRAGLSPQQTMSLHLRFTVHICSEMAVAMSYTYTILKSLTVRRASTFFAPALHFRFPAKFRNLCRLREYVSIMTNFCYSFILD